MAIYPPLLYIDPPRENVLLSDPTAIFIFLAGLLGTIFWLNGPPRFQPLFRVTSAVIKVARKILRHLETRHPTRREARLGRRHPTVSHPADNHRCAKAASA